VYIVRCVYIIVHEPDLNYAKVVCFVGLVVESVVGLVVESKSHPTHVHFHEECETNAQPQKQEQDQRYLEQRLRV